MSRDRESGQYAGSCHCGAAGYRYTTALPQQRWSIRACQCSFCLRHGALSTSDPDGKLRFSGDYSRYRFGLRTADFLLCPQCGVYLGALIDTQKGLFGIVNVRTLEVGDGTLAPDVPADYAAENTAVRIARREAHWTPAAVAPSAA
ncbi:MAG: hypothetical protein AAFX56_03390 [Pseudomonadota bacterium]